MRADLNYPEPVGLTLPAPDRARMWRRGLQTSGWFAFALAPAGYRAAARRPSAVATATDLKRAFEALGGTFLKLGQIIASSPGMFGDEVSAVFRSCLDTGPVVPEARVRATIESDLGRPLEACFAWFDPSPIGRASLAVVHRATTLDGQQVAVKILRPGIRSAVATDLALLVPLARRLADTVGIEVVAAIDGLVDGLREQLQEELDLRNELRTLEHHRQLLDLADTPLVVIPRGHPTLSGQRVLTMDFLDGVAIDDPASLAAFGVDPRPLARELVRYWFASALRDGTFHADVHAGNVMALRDGRLGLIDWGIVGRLDPDTHRFFRNAVGAMLGNDDAWDELVVYLEDTYGPMIAESMGGADVDIADMIKTVFKPFFTQPFSAFSMAQIMQQMPQAQGLGTAGGQRSAREMLGHWREVRRIRRMEKETGVRTTPFSRGMMMLMKQLLYFDRYGHLFLTDSALLDDTERYRAILDEA